MRIIKEYSVDDLHVTIFKMAEKFTLKLEKDRNEQVFKLDTRDGVDTLESVEFLINDEFIQSAKQVFSSMQTNRMKRLSALYEKSGDSFPNII